MKPKPNQTQQTHMKPKPKPNQTHQIDQSIYHRESLLLFHNQQPSLISTSPSKSPILTPLSLSNPSFSISHPPPPHHKSPPPLPTTYLHRNLEKKKRKKREGLRAWTRFNRRFQKERRKKGQRLRERERETGIKERGIESLNKERRKIKMQTHTCTKRERIESNHGSGKSEKKKERYKQNT